MAHSHPNAAVPSPLAGPCMPVGPHLQLICPCRPPAQAGRSAGMRRRPAAGRAAQRRRTPTEAAANDPPARRPTHPAQSRHKLGAGGPLRLWALGWRKNAALPPLRQLRPRLRAAWTPVSSSRLCRAGESPPAPPPSPPHNALSCRCYPLLAHARPSAPCGCRVLTKPSHSGWPHACCRWLEREERIRIGQACKQLIDRGRMLWLQAQGFQVMAAVRRSHALWLCPSCSCLALCRGCAPRSCALADGGCAVWRGHGSPSW